MESAPLFFDETSDMDNCWCGCCGLLGLLDREPKSWGRDNLDRSSLCILVGTPLREAATRGKAELLMRSDVEAELDCW